MAIYNELSAFGKVTSDDGSPRNATWFKLAPALIGVELYTGTDFVADGTSVQLEKARDICRIWVDEGRVANSLVQRKS